GRLLQPSQLPLPRLLEEPHAEFRMRRGRHALEAGALVDAPRVHQHAARPQADLAVAAGAREADAFVDQPGAEAEPARLRIDQQQAELRDLGRALLEEDATDRLAVEVGDPAALARGIVVLDVVRDDLGAKPFERRTPAVFPRVELAVPLHHPAELACA